MTKKTDRPSAAVRIRVMKRDRFTCTYCGASGNDVELEVDHIIPVSKGGSNHISNLTTACFSCNRKKGNGALKQQDKPRDTNSLIDKPIHILCDGKIENQGVILENINNGFAIQRYSWVDGAPTDVIFMPYNDLFNNEKCKIYANDYEWHKAYEREQATKAEAQWHKLT